MQLNAVPPAPTVARKTLRHQARPASNPRREDAPPSEPLRPVEQVVPRRSRASPIDAACRVSEAASRRQAPKPQTHLRPWGLTGRRCRRSACRTKRARPAAARSGERCQHHPVRLGREGPAAVAGEARRDAAGRSDRQPCGYVGIVAGLSSPPGTCTRSSLLRPRMLRSANRVRSRAHRHGRWCRPQKPSDRWSVGLRRTHYAEQHWIGERAFEAKHALDLKALAERFAAASPHSHRI